MPVTNLNLPLLHRQEWQMMTPAPIATSAGTFVIAPDSGNHNFAMFVASATAHYMYQHDEDAWFAIPSGALAGAFGAGACGVYHPWSIAYTANGGTTSTVTVSAAAFNICGLVKGKVIEFISAGASTTGLRRTIADINTAVGGTGNIVLTLDTPVPDVVANNHTFRINSGRFYVLNAYASIAAGIFKVFDVGTLNWQASLQTTGLPASWGTDGRMVVAYNYGEIIATGTSTGANSTTTLNNTGKAWTVNQWTNYQVRITGGLGVGQVRQISSNTATALTVTPVWTTTPDATSTYELTASEDYLYLLGNNAVTMYRYSISANTWTTMAPTTARSAAPGTGMTAGVVGISGETTWAVENAILNGRYLYSFRGAGSGVLDRFDIAGGTAGAGAWQVITFINGETFTTGSSGFIMGKYIYLRKDATNRFFKYSIEGNHLEGLSTNLYADSTAIVGNKIWVKNLDSSQAVQWVYSLGNTLTTLHRLLLFP